MNIESMPKDVLDLKEDSRGESKYDKWASAKMQSETVEI